MTLKIDEITQQELLEHLPLEMKRALLFYMSQEQGWTYQGLSDVLGISVDAIKSSVKRLKKYIEKNHPEAQVHDYFGDMQSQQKKHLSYNNPDYDLTIHYFDNVNGTGLAKCVCYAGGVLFQAHGANAIEQVLEHLSDRPEGRNKTYVVVRRWRPDDIIGFGEL